MNKTIIILKQNQNKGKTSTLNFLIEKLRGIAIASCIDAPPLSDGDDKAIVVPIEGKNIGVVTLGDPGYEDQFRNWLNFCLYHQSDFIVIATRTQETVNGKITPYGVLWKEYINKEGWTTIETSPYVIYKHGSLMDLDKLNKLCAENLLKKYNQYLNITIS